jgi:hypothetical protein
MPLDAEMFLANAVRAARLAAAEVWEPPPPVDFTQWATENVVFGNESPKPGAYDPDYHPWDRFFFEALQPDHPAREVIDVGSAQSGKTLRAQIFVGGSQALDPGPMIVYHPTLPNAISWAQQKWRIFVRNTRALAKLFPVGKSRDVGNSMLYQERADGRGHVEIAGANSPAALSQRSKPKQVQDDLSKWELNSAGDPETQADNRSRAFAWAKNYKISTPLMNPGCKISRKYKLSTQGEFHLPCPHCAALAPLTWDNFRLSVEAMIEARKHGKPETPAHFTCGSCGAVIEEKHRAGMLKGIACVHKNLEAGAKLGIWGFYVWAAYVPGESWASIAEGWIAAAGDPSREQVFYNDTLGLPYEVQGEAPPWEKIRERAEATGHALGRIPAGGIMLTIGADCQGDRVEWHCKAFGRDGRRWTIEYGVIDGHISEDRAKAGLDAAAAHLARCLRQQARRRHDRDRRQLRQGRRPRLGQALPAGPRDHGPRHPRRRGAGDDAGQGRQDRRRAGDQDPEALLERRRLEPQGRAVQGAEQDRSASQGILRLPEGADRGVLQAAVRREPPPVQGEKNRRDGMALGPDRGAGQRSARYRDVRRGRGPASRLEALHRQGLGPAHRRARAAGARSPARPRGAEPARAGTEARAGGRAARDRPRDRSAAGGAGRPRRHPVRHQPAGLFTETMTMAFTQAQIDALKEAIALGVTQVSYQGRITTYRSLEDMKASLRMMEDSVASGGNTPRRTTYATFRRG